MTIQELAAQYFNDGEKAIGDIERAATNLAHNNKALSELDSSIRGVAGSVAAQVHSETVDGKPLYSNDDKRKAETNRRLSENEHYRSLCSKASDARADVTMAETSLLIARKEVDLCIAFLRGMQH